MAHYTLYTDKNETFECDLNVKNASLKEAFARVIVETEGLTLMFPGVLKNGKCEVPIKRLKGLLEENATGKIHLEVVVEDTYFKPWESKFIVEQHTAVKAVVMEQKKPCKPLVEVKSVKKTGPKTSDAASDLLYICERLNINKSNVNKRKKDLQLVIKEYFKANPEHIKNCKKFILEAVTALK
jgi:hypothetical protein